MAIEAFDLDALEREPEHSAMEPFPVKHGGKTYLLVAPDEYDYKTWMEVQRALSERRAPDALALMIPPADREEFFKTPLPLWKANKAAGAYNAHYKLPNPNEKSVGEAGASSTS